MTDSGSARRGADILAWFLNGTAQSCTTAATRKLHSQHAGRQLESISEGRAAQHFQGWQTVRAEAKLCQFLLEIQCSSVSMKQLQQRKRDIFTWQSGIFCNYICVCLGLCFFVSLQRSRVCFLHRSCVQYECLQVSVHLLCLRLWTECVDIHVHVLLLFFKYYCALRIIVIVWETRLTSILYVRKITSMCTVSV